MVSAQVSWLAWRSTGVAVHLVAFINYGFLIVRDLWLRPGVARHRFGSAKFLTHWDIWLQLITFAICLVCDMMPHSYTNETPLLDDSLANNTVDSAQNVAAIKANSTSHGAETAITGSEPMGKSGQPATSGRPSWYQSSFGGRLVVNVVSVYNLRDNLVLALAFPVGTFVTLMFWTLYLINEDYVTNPELRKNTPMYIQHLQHTVVAPLILAELLINHHRLISARFNCYTLLLFYTLYVSWMLFLGVNYNDWAYPLFAKMSWWQIALFLSAVLLAVGLLFMLAHYLVRRCWPHSRVQRFYKCHSDAYALNECSLD